MHSHDDVEVMKIGNWTG